MTEEIIKHLKNGFTIEFDEDFGRKIKVTVKDNLGHYGRCLLSYREAEEAHFDALALAVDEAVAILISNIINGLTMK